MDAASKYKNLPGIALDQPDVYETSDLPEVDQARKARPPTEDVSSNVEILPVNPDVAFKKFEGKQIKVSGVDFANYPFGPKGYQSWGEFELLPPDQKDEETPIQKYRRLVLEISNLQQLLKGIDKGKKSSEGLASGDLNVVDVVDNLEGLRQSLQNLNCESWLDGVINTLAVHSKPFAQLEHQLSHQTSSEVTASQAKDTPSSEVIYELRCRPDQTRASEKALLSNLEHKVHQLELLVGEQGKTSLLSSSTHNKSLFEAVQELSKKVTLMDAHHVEQLDSRLNSLLQKVTTLSDKKSAIEEADKNAKVKEILDLIHETEGQRASLPVIASRLKALSDVEEQAVQFSNAVSYIDSLQSQITSDLKNCQDDLKSLKESLSQNMTLFKKKMDQFEQRIQALK